MSRTVHLIVPGRLDQRTGGYLYDARMVEGLRSRGWRVVAHELPGRFPDPDELAARALRGALQDVPDGAVVVADGLAIGGVPDAVSEASLRLRIVALVHHPLADETGLPAPERARFARLERHTLAAARGVIVTSSHTRDRLADYGVTGRSVRVVEPGTEPAEPATGPPPGAPTRLLCVGSVTPRKGHDVLIDALGTLLDIPAWECICAGSLERHPSFSARVRRRGEEAGLSSRLRFVGEQSSSALDALYHTSSFLVHPSWYEGYGMVLTEALVRGLPIVGTTGGAVPHTVPPEAGTLVEPGDAPHLAEVLRLWLTEPTVRARCAAAARRSARRLPRWDTQVEAFETAIEGLGGHV